MGVVAVMAATPFVQAVATHFGNRLAGSIDERTRAAVRRFLRREAEENGQLSERGVPNSHRIELTTEHGWRVQMSEDISPDGLAQLASLCRANPPGSRTTPPRVGTIWWSGEFWVAFAGVEFGPLLYTWQPPHGWISHDNS